MILVCFRPKIIYSVFGTVLGHNVSVKFEDFVVNKLVDVLLRYGSCFGGCAYGSVFCKFIGSLVAPESRVGCDPSQLHLVASTDVVEDVEAVVDCFVLGDKGCERVDGGEAICPYDNMLVGIVCELLAGISNGCKFRLLNGGAEHQRKDDLFALDVTTTIYIRALLAHERYSLAPIAVIKPETMFSCNYVTNISLGRFKYSRHVHKF